MATDSIIFVIRSGKEITIIKLQPPIFSDTIGHSQKKIIGEANALELLAFFQIHKPQPHSQSTAKIKAASKFFFQNESGKEVMNTGLQSTRSIKAVIAVFSLQPDVAEIFPTCNPIRYPEPESYEVLSKPPDSKN